MAADWDERLNQEVRDDAHPCHSTQNLRFRLLTAPIIALALTVAGCAENDPVATFDGTGCSFEGQRKFTLDYHATFALINTSDPRTRVGGSSKGVEIAENGRDLKRVLREVDDAFCKARVITRNRLICCGVDLTSRDQLRSRRSFSSDPERRPSHYTGKVTRMESMRTDG